MQPLGDQPAAIEALVRGLREGRKHQTLLGVTGSGKTFSMGHVINQINKPTLVISHNKTLAAQLYEEFKELFPDNAVCYFVSYYDYYQPEAYIPQRDIYIEKDSSKNEDLDRLRLYATSNLVSRRDVIVVASVSCIFGLGSPEEYSRAVISLNRGQALERQDLLKALSEQQYKRAEFDFQRGTYRVRGDVVEVHPAGEQSACRIELLGEQIESLALVHPTTGEVLAQREQIFIYPAVHYVMPQDKVQTALASIRAELEMRFLTLRNEGKLLEAQRLMARTKYDLEMIQEVGYCSGIENYSRHLDGRLPGEKPYTLLDYFGQDYLMLIDESHVTLPQLRAMYNGDQNRKKTLVEHGFRLPSALDNRPLRFEEIEQFWPQVIFVSATPGPYELAKSQGGVVEQVIRPTGLVDPVLELSPAAGQVEHLMHLARERAAKGERTLVTTLTKRLAEALARYLAEQGLKCRYLHSDIQTLDRVEILGALRRGQYDVLIGVNLLREGLDLPEVSLVAIMDADKTGFLRSATSLIQQIGRSARHVNATVVLYADTVTAAMKQAIDETNRRCTLQVAFNAEHGITPRSIRKEIRRSIELEVKAHQTAREVVAEDEGQYDRIELLAALEKQMLEAAERLEFEEAARLRDRVRQIKEMPDLGPAEAGEGAEAKPQPGTPGTRTTKKRRSGQKWVRP